MGLVWLQDANCFGLRNWTSDWSLPNVKELQSLIDFGQYSPALPVGHPFYGVQFGGYWSSTAYANGPGNAWRVGLHNGSVGIGANTNNAYVWPVRGGQ